jgi:hypothetical protein
MMNKSKLMTLAMLAACDPGSQIAISSHGLAFEEWAATLERNDRGAFVVEGDIAIHGEDRLRSYFEEEMPQPGALTVAVRNGTETRWGMVAKYDLTYCVSDGFGTRKQAAVDAVAAAARAWEQVAEVRFVYVPAEDDDCDNTNTNVLFNVRSGDCGSTCNATAFFPGDARSERELIIDGALTAPLPRTPVGVMTHELGHILGFRHEHIWDACTTEGEIDSGLDAEHLTPVDTASVMYYLQCADATHANGYQISEQDALGAACKYNASIPRSACHEDRTNADVIWNSNGSLRTWSGQTYSLNGLYHPIAGDFDGNGRDDILFYGRGTRADFIWWAGTGGFTSVWTESSGLYEPVAGDFDGDSRDDIFWYGGKSRPDFIWYGNTNRTFTSQSYTFSGAYLPKAGDFDGDGRDDLLLYGHGSLADSIMWSNGNRTFTSMSINMGGTYDVFVVDQNGDGRDDIFWYEPGTTVDPLWRGNSTRQFSLIFNYQVDGEYVPIVGNFDGQSGQDIIWYGQGSDPDSIWYSNGGQPFTSVGMTITNHAIPIAADTNGDGDTDLVWYSPF